MPYSSDAGLPSHVKKMSAKKRRQWRHVWNSTFKRTRSESRAFAAANGVVKEALVSKPFELLVGDKAVKVTMYTGADDPDLPDHVKGLPMSTRSSWVNMYNYGLVDYKDGEQALRYANEYTTVSVGSLSTKESRRPAGVPEPAEDEDEAEEVEEDEDEEDYVPEPVNVTKSKGKGRSFLTRLKAWLSDDQATASDIAPVLPASLSTFTVYKGEDGATRVLLVYSNNFKDKQKEIISEAAHQEYAAAAESGEAIYPDLHLWHGGPATKWGVVETVSEVGGFAVAGGVVDAGKEHVAQTLKELADKGEIAVSFGFYGLRGPDGTYHLYRPFELSPLPVGSEANPYTSITYAKESDMAFSDKKKAWLKTHFKMDDAGIVAAEQKFANMAASLKAAGIDYKDADEATEGVASAPPPPAPAPAPAPPAPTPPSAGGDVLFGQMVAMAGALEGMAGAIKSLQTDFAAYKSADAQTVEARAEDQVLARIANAGRGFVPTAAAGNVQPGMKDSEQNDWLDKALGMVFTAPTAPGGGAAVGHANGEAAR